MRFNPPREWFGKKTVGWGYSPHTWEGWVILLVVGIAAVVISSTAFN